MADFTRDTRRAGFELSVNEQMPEGNGHWPRSLKEAVIMLLKGLSEHAKLGLKQASGEEQLAVLHATLGTTIRNEFGLWRGNTALLKACGSETMHPDDASMVIIKATRRELRRREK